jgi:hypothetical protein
MTPPLRRGFWLFVAGEPDRGLDPLRDVETSVFRRAAGVLVGGAIVGAPSEHRDGELRRDPTAPAPVPWHLPAPQAQCAAIVLEIAHTTGVSVTVLDINLASSPREVIDRWVRPDDLLPLLVRGDGVRLQGLEEFVPGKIRRFLRGA